MSYSAQIERNISNYHFLQLIDMNRLYHEKFNEIPEQTFFKIINRMEKKGALNRVGKGVYCRPKKSRFGIISANENNILDYYLGKNKKSGIVSGYRLFNNYGLTTQVSKSVEVYSIVINQSTKQIRNVKVKKINIKIHDNTKRMVELLEVLQNYNKIEDINYPNLAKYLKNTIRYYDEREIYSIIKSMKYKKSTIASLEVVLDYYNVKNTLDTFLRQTSRYQTINMEELNEFAS